MFVESVENDQFVSVKSPFFGVENRVNLLCRSLFLCGLVCPAKINTVDGVDIRISFASSFALLFTPTLHSLSIQALLNITNMLF